MSTRSGSTKTPRKDSSRTGRGKKKVEFLGYVNWTLTDAYKAAFEKWLTTNPDIDRLVDQLIEDGYAVKIRYDDYNQCRSAGLYCTDVDSGNAGWTLSMRAATWVKALERVLFVHYVAFDGLWVTAKEEGWSDDSW